MLISILTPTIPGRERFLEECVASVEAQTLRDFEHLVWRDEQLEGCAVTMNRLAGMARGEWLLPLADDDVLLPRCLELLSEVADADIIYAPPLVWGVKADPWWFYQAPPAIPSFALIRAAVWDKLGGYDESLRREEDRDLWTRALDAGCRFIRFDRAPTWVYRVHQGSKSFQENLQAVA